MSLQKGLDSLKLSMMTGLDFFPDISPSSCCSGRSSLPTYRQFASISFRIFLRLLVAVGDPAYQLTANLLLTYLGYGPIIYGLSPLLEAQIHSQQHKEHIKNLST
jgi:hypothetical protein